MMSLISLVSLQLKQVCAPKLSSRYLVTFMLLNSLQHQHTDNGDDSLPFLILLSLRLLDTILFLPTYGPLSSVFFADSSFPSSPLM